jgi:hypothetical protein
MDETSASAKKLRSNLRVARELMISVDMDPENISKALSSSQDILQLLGWTVEDMKHETADSD